MKNHMNNWRIVTRSGLKLNIRAVTPDDDALLADFFHHIRPEDLRFRFLSSIKEVGAEQIRRMTHIDHQANETYVAFSEDDGIVVAVAALAGDEAKQKAEVAISVHADHHHQGIGWEMLALLADQAAARGLKSIESIENRNNHEAIEVERNMGFAVSSYPGDNTLVLVSKQLR
jgi:RimJ/RimL family protein N-acetyltransferase